MFFSSFSSISSSAFLFSSFLFRFSHIFTILFPEWLSFSLIWCFSQFFPHYFLSCFLISHFFSEVCLFLPFHFPPLLFSSRHIVSVVFFRRALLSFFPVIRQHFPSRFFSFLFQYSSFMFFRISFPPHSASYFRLIPPPLFHVPRSLPSLSVLCTFASVLFCFSSHCFRVLAFLSPPCICNWLLVSCLPLSCLLFFLLLFFATCSFLSFVYFHSFRPCVYDLIGIFTSVVFTIPTQTCLAL